MIEEAAVPFFNNISDPDNSLYPAMTGYQFFGLKKKMKFTWLGNYDICSFVRVEIFN